jgi:hypothetical protein
VHYFKPNENVKIILGELASEGAVVRFYGDGGLVHLKLHRPATVNGREVLFVAVDEASLASAEPQGLGEDEEIIASRLPEKKDEDPMALTFNEGFRRDRESKRPKYCGAAADRIADGLCPECGEKGYFSMSQAVCTKHGPY